MRVARSVAGLPASGIRRFFDVVAQMEDVISLGVGEPDFATPWHIREAAIYSLERGFTQYSSNSGLPPLRREIARHLREAWGHDYSPDDEVLVTVGVSEGLDLALRAVLDPGDEVLIPEPCYVSYRPCTVLAGGVPVPVPGCADSGFAVDPAALAAAITPRTRALILNYPCNPTGRTLRRPTLEAIAALVGRRDLLVISDEIYAEMTYGEPHVSFPVLEGMRDRTLLLSGFSKAYAMTGWRIGYAAGPREWIAGMIKIHQYTMLCAPMPSQHAALEALRCGRPEVDRMVADYESRGRVLAAGLARIGLPCSMPEGAFYVFPRIDSTGLNAEMFAERLLRQERVAVVPGTAFGDCGTDFVRCSYATAIAQLTEALDRMERFLRSLAGQAAAPRVPMAVGG